MAFNHVSVLLNECIENLNIKQNGIYVDGTMGGAGHSFHILEKLNHTGTLIGIDRDLNAIEASKQRLQNFENKIIFHNNFCNIKQVLKQTSFVGVDGILLDLGVSSHQLDEAERGFSYHQNARLDMRMNREDAISAYDVVNGYSVDDLTRIIKDYGEENWAKRIALTIEEKRKIKPIETTFELVDAIKAAIPKAVRAEGKHPAKRTFQAIRIEVNGELEILKGAITNMVDILNHQGRLCIITFHSLEDRIVKQTFKELENPCICPRDFPICVCGKKPQIKIITKKPILPSDEELENNLRSRSAKLRVIEKL